jgi:hypothetical protein
VNRSSLPIPVELQRLRHVHGQEMRSADFRDALANEAQTRWWHNRAKHESYGVARGLEAFLDALPSGDAAIRVAPGVAYDCFGRELFVCTERWVALPEGLSEGRVVTLMLGPPESGKAARRGTVLLSAACPDPSPSRCLGEEGTLSWDFGAVPQIREGVPIVRVRRDDEAGWLLDPFSFRSRAAARARFGRGETLRGATDWRPWTAGSGTLLLGVDTVVSTAAAGFVRTPHYFAHFQGAGIPRELAQALDEGHRVGPLIPLLHLDEATPHRFTARVFLAFGRGDTGSPATPLGSLVQALYRRDIALCWLGIEPLPGTIGDMEPL